MRRFAHLVPFAKLKKNIKNTHGGVLLLVKLQVSACNSTKSNTLPRVFFIFFELHKWYHIAQSITYVCVWAPRSPRYLRFCQIPKTQTEFLNPDELRKKYLRSFDKWPLWPACSNKISNQNNQIMNKFDSQNTIVD